MIHWLASYPKSGNTWVRLFLTAYRDGGRLEKLTGLIGSIDLSPYLFQVVAPVPLDKLSSFDVAALRPAVLLHAVTAANGTPVIMKTHHCFADHWELSLFPDPFVAPSVYVVRDPRDVVCSYADHMGQDFERTVTSMAAPRATIETGHGPLYHVLSSWSNHVRSWSDVPAVLVIRYEDMEREPARTFSKIVEHVSGEKADPERVERSADACSFDRVQGMETRDGFGEKTSNQAVFFRRGKSGGWRKELPGELADRIEHEHTDMMDRYGYERAAVPA